MYGVKYKVPFKTLSDRDSVVILEERGYTGSVIELIAGGTPFIINTDQSDLLTPIRSSTATLAVVGSDYLQDLYANDPQGIRVKCEVDGVVKWLGYLLPDTFSQDFSSSEFVYEVEAVAAISTLKYKEFDLTDDFVTFRQIIDKAIEYSGYKVVYLTNSVRAEFTDYFNLKIATANFYDELGEAMTYYEVLEQIAAFAGCCWTPYEDDLYFLDYQAIRSGYNSYTRIEGNSASNVTLQDLKEVENYKGTGTKLSRIAGKNKATVNCSLYEIKDILPVFDDERSVFFEMKEYPRTITSGKTTSEFNNIIRYYKQPKFTFYKTVVEGSNLVEYEGDRLGESQYVLGSCFVRTTSYNEESKPNKLSFDNEIQIRNYYDIASNRFLSRDSRIITLKTDKSIVFHKGVYFCFSCSVKFNNGIIQNNTSIDTVPDEFIYIPVKFKVGDYYYSANGWTTTESRFSVPFQIEDGKLFGLYHSVKDTNDFTLGLGELNGYIFKAPEFIISGRCELTLYNPADMRTYMVGNSYTYIKDIRFEYTIPNEQSIYGDWVDKDTRNDVIYENVIDDGYVEEADEIDLKICTNTEGKLALSSLLESNNFLSKIRTDVFGTGIAEEILLQRVVSLYSKPRFVIDPTLENNAKPYTKFTEPHLNKQFLVAGGEEDVKMETMQYNLIEA